MSAGHKPEMGGRVCMPHVTTHSKRAEIIDPREIRRSAARGAIFVAGRQVVVQGINVLGTVLLTRALSTYEFGFYAILVFASQATSLLSGTALALQAVRSPIPLSTRALRVLFTAQLALAASGCLILWVGAPEIARAYHARQEITTSLRLIALAVLLSCLQTIPTALMERNLQFGRLAVAEISRALSFNVVAVGAAYAGWGIQGVSLGILVRVIVGAATVNCLKRWKFGLAFDLITLKSELGSGVAYLGAAAVSVIKDSITPVFMGLLLGAADVGLVSWATRVASYCVIALMMLQRLYIPTFSRMASHPRELSGFVTSVLKITNSVAAPAACLILAFIRPITINVFGDKWLSAIPVFYLFWGANLIVPTVTPLVSLLQALNRGRIAFYLAVMWMLLTWILGIPAIWCLGILGAGLANLLVQFSNYIVLRIVRQHISIRVLPNVLPFWIIALVAAGMMRIGAVFVPPESLRSTIIYLIMGGLLYLIGVWLIKRRDVRSIASLMKQSVAR